MSDSAPMTDVPSQWVTPMVVLGNGEQTKAYGSFVSSSIISSSTRAEVYALSCAPSQCDGTEFPEQTVTQYIEMYICPGDSNVCPDEDEEGDGLTTTALGYPLGWKGTVSADGTTTEWEARLSVLKDDERSAGATGDDLVTWIATTKVGDDVKATMSSVADPEESGCRLYDNYVVAAITAGVDELFEGYPDYMLEGEQRDVDEYGPMFQQQRSACAKLTSGRTTTESGPEETGSSDSQGDDDEDANGDDDDDSEEDAGGKLSLSFALMGALLAVGILLP